jgi:hypothetical protein
MSIKRTINGVITPNKTRTADKNTICAIPFVGDAITSFRRVAVMKVPRTTRNGTSLQTKYYYCIMINVGKSENASGDGCIRKEYDVIARQKSLTDACELEIKKLTEAYEKGATKKKTKKY